jgi:uncharacterized protein YceK
VDGPEGDDVTTVLLLGVLALVLVGCVSVVWADRGGPRRVRVAANVTLTPAQVARWAGRSRGRSGSSSGGDGGE